MLASGLPRRDAPKIGVARNECISHRCECFFQLMNMMVGTEDPWETCACLRINKYSRARSTYLPTCLPVYLPTSPPTFLPINVGTYPPMYLHTFLTRVMDKEEFWGCSWRGHGGRAGCLCFTPVGILELFWGDPVTMGDQQRNNQAWGR